jgi:hypothetical protein
MPPIQESFCKSCGAPILFLLTANHRWMPVDAATVAPGDERFVPDHGHVAHWSTCPEADQHRRRAGPPGGA